MKVKILMFLVLVSILMLSACSTTTKVNNLNPIKDDSCGECRQYSPPAPGWCSNGTIIPPETDECGCLRHPVCE